MLLIFLDSETTGLNPEKHRIVEIAFRIFDSAVKKFVVSYDALLSQPEEVWDRADPQSLEINGLTWDTNLKGKTEERVAAEVIEIFNHAHLKEQGGVFIGQNPSFDRAFFSQIIPIEVQEEYHWPYHWLDLASMYFAKKQLQDPTILMKMQESDLSKDKIAHTLGLSKEARPHRAMNGVNHLISCYEALFASS